MKSLKFRKFRQKWTLDQLHFKDLLNRTRENNSMEQIVFDRMLFLLRKVKRLSICKQTTVIYLASSLPLWQLHKRWRFVSKGKKKIYYTSNFTTTKTWIQDGGSFIVEHPPDCLCSRSNHSQVIYRRNMTSSRTCFENGWECFRLAISGIKIFIFSFEKYITSNRFPYFTQNNGWK